jgi:pSer/pThr/pTyr-binding forkhead associated (FHA) protein
MPLQVKKADPPRLKVQVEWSGGQREYDFVESFRIGRLDDCAVCIPDEHVSRAHAEISYLNDEWCVRDLNSSNGIYVGDQRFKVISVPQSVSIRLGIRGPLVTLSVVTPSPIESNPAGDETLLARYVDRYFGKTRANQPVGQHTMFVRQAFAKVQKKQKRYFAAIVFALLMCLAAAGIYAWYEHRELARQRAIAEEIFYSMKALDVDIAKLKRMVNDSNNTNAVQIMHSDEDRRRKMEKNYDQLLSSIHFYDSKMTGQQRLIIRVARIFGECELNMPPDFVSEVEKYIGYWKSTKRFENAVRAANNNGYTAPIYKTFLAQGLPPQFFYLAMQESNFDPYRSGPLTRKGYAKGMWQFIPETAVKYDLKLGPLFEFPRPDPADDRSHWERETTAAARYISDLYGTDAQASGLLVMACYNWGENRVLPLVRSMPENPRERNFWQLLAKHRDEIPKETYDYVFYIISAAAIGENPRLFGFDMDNPLASVENDLPQIH